MKRAGKPDPGACPEGTHSPLAILTRMAFPGLLLKGHIAPQLAILGLWQASLAKRAAG